MQKSLKLKIFFIQKSALSGFTPKTSQCGKFIAGRNEAHSRHKGASTIAANNALY